MRRPSFNSSPQNICRRRRPRRSPWSPPWTILWGGGGGGKRWAPRSPWSPPSLVYKYNNIFLISIEITIVNSPRRPRRPKGDNNLEKIHGGDQGDQGDLLGLLRGIFCGGGGGEMMVSSVSLVSSVFCI